MPTTHCGEGRWNALCRSSSASFLVFILMIGMARRWYCMSGKSVYWPLYGYTADTSPGDARGQDTYLNGGVWYVMQPDGQPLIP